MFQRFVNTGYLQTGGATENESVTSLKQLLKGIMENEENMSAVNTYLEELNKMDAETIKAELSSDAPAAPEASTGEGAAVVETTGPEAKQKPVVNLQESGESSTDEEETKKPVVGYMDVAPNPEGEAPAAAVVNLGQSGESSTDVAQNPEGEAPEVGEAGEGPAEAEGEAGEGPAESQIQALGEEAAAAEEEVAAAEVEAEGPAEGDTNYLQIGDDSEVEEAPVGETEEAPVGETEEAPVGETEEAPVGETEEEQTRNEFAEQMGIATDSDFTGGSKKRRSTKRRSNKKRSGKKTAKKIRRF